MHRRILSLAFMLALAVAARADDLAGLSPAADLTAPQAEDAQPSVLQHRIERLERLLQSFQDEGMAPLPPDDFAEVAQTHWTHSPHGILICLAEMREGACMKRRENSTDGGYDPVPWLTPQEYLDWLNPSVPVRYTGLSYYPPTKRLFLFYRVLTPQASNRAEMRH